MRTIDHKVLRLPDLQIPRLSPGRRALLKVRKTREKTGANSPTSAKRRSRPNHIPLVPVRRANANAKDRTRPNVQGLCLYLYRTRAKTSYQPPKGCKTPLVRPLLNEATR